MKRFFIAIVLHGLLCSHIHGEIKNGYEKDILRMRESLKSLSALLDEDKTISETQRRVFESRVDQLVNNISYYELTQSLLDQFRMITPALYNEIDTIKDSKLRAVNVYVKFIPTEATTVQAWGTTYMSQIENDQDGYVSEYGAHSVSVKIWIVSNALLVLAHEFGHVKYQVPHLASYCEYYKEHYYNIMNSSNYIGHDTSDPSGKSASQYEKLFRKEFGSFLKLTTEKVMNPVALVEKIKKKLTHDKILL